MVSELGKGGGGGEIAGGLNLRRVGWRALHGFLDINGELATAKRSD